MEWAGHFSPDQLVYIPASRHRWSPSLSPIRSRHPRVHPSQPPPASSASILAPSPWISHSGHPLRVPSHRTFRNRRSQARPIPTDLPQPPPPTLPTPPLASTASNSGNHPRSYPQLRSPFRSARLQNRRRCCASPTRSARSSVTTRVVAPKVITVSLPAASPNPLSSTYSVPQPVRLHDLCATCLWNGVPAAGVGGYVGDSDLGVGVGCTV